MTKKITAYQRLQVLFITAWYPDENNPVNGVFVREHAKAVQRYADVTVLHFAGHTADFAQEHQIEAVTDPALTEAIDTYRLRYRTPKIPWTSYLVRGWNFIQTFRYLRKQGVNPDIIHVHVHSVALPAVLLGMLFRIPVVITEHHSAFPLHSLTKRQVREARIAFRCAARVMPVSKALQEGIESYNINAHFQVVPNVVDMELFQLGPKGQPAHDIIQFLCVATMPPTHVKGISYLLEAVAQLRNSFSDWQLKIIGDGLARPDYEEQAHQLKVQDQVKFLGRKSKTEVADAMRNADVFVLPSVWDNMPCVIIEAMASGLPIVATQVGGIPEMVEEQNGILVPARDAKALCAALKAMVTQHTAYDHDQIAATARSRYSQEAVGRLFYSIYQKCIDESIH